MFNSTHAQAIARAFAAREDLRAPICAALTRLCDQALEVVCEDGKEEGASDDDRDDEEVALSGEDESDSEDETSDSDDDDDDSDLDAAAASTPIAAASSSRPAAYTPQVAAATLAVLRSQAKNWLPLLLNAYVSSPLSARAPTAAAVASLSQSPLCAPRRAVEAMFGSALTKLAAATRDAAVDPPVPNGKASDGGETPGERRATFLGAALALSSALTAANGEGDGDDDGDGENSPSAGGIDALWDAAVDAAGDREQAVQKSAYRVLAAVLSRERRRSAEIRRKKNTKKTRGGKKGNKKVSSPWLDDNLERVLSDLLSRAPAALPAAKRHRLAAVREAVRAVRRQRGGLRTGGGGEGENGEGEEEADPVASLVAEAVLCVKEPNRRTRAAAYELLVDLGRPSSSSFRVPEFDSSSSPLAELVALICGGLAAGAGSADWGGGAVAAASSDTFSCSAAAATSGPASPHVASAAVMALARLLHAYPSELAFAGAKLLPAVLPLLRTRSRELVKAVLGFAKVAASRLPVEELLGNDDDHKNGDGDGEMANDDARVISPLASSSLRNGNQKQSHYYPRLKQLLEALLVWSDDPKNKFRLRVRLVVERLVRRLGAEAVSSAMPAGDARLLSHIRKAEARKARRRGGRSRGGEDDYDDDDGGDEDDDDGGDEDDDGMLFDDSRSRRTAAKSSGRGGAKALAARSEWAHTAVFGAATTRRDAASTKAGGGGGGGGKNLGGGGARLPGDGRGRDPLDLLGAGAARALAAAPRGGGSASRRSRAGDDGESRPLPLAPDGRLVIMAEEAGGENGSSKKKRKAGGPAEDGYDSGDSDFDDVRGAAVDARAAWRATAGARSLASGAARSVAASAKSLGGRSARTDVTRKAAPGGGGGGASHHSAERFRASKGGASGDVIRSKKGGTKSGGGKGHGAVEPYAYWPLDRKMLNRRPTKARVAAGGLEKVVAAGRAGARAAARDAKRRRK